MTPRWRALRPWRRHSLVLLVAGVVYMLLGFAYALTPLDPARASALRAALALAPMPVWGGVFVLTGLGAILSARWPLSSEKWGYSAMCGVTTLWGAFYGLGLLQGGPASNFTGLLIWGIFGFMWWAISGLVNPDDLREGLVP